MKELQARQPQLLGTSTASAAAELAAVQERLNGTPPFTHAHTCSCPEPRWEQQCERNAVYHGIQVTGYVAMPRFVRTCCQVKAVAYPHTYAAGCAPASPVRPTTLVSLDVIHQFKILHLHAGLSAESE